VEGFKKNERKWNLPPYKPNMESKEYRILSSLNARMDLSSINKMHYSYLEKGYQGEIIFDQLTSKLQNDLYILNDLCLEQNKSFFQIDTLIISQHTIYPYEVKNYEGDYRYESRNFYPKLSKDEIKDIPPTQLNSLMKKLNEIPSKLTDRHKMLADQLISMATLAPPRFLLQLSITLFSSKSCRYSSSFFLRDDFPESSMLKTSRNKGEITYE
jgi:hypothetical protein